MADNYLEKRYSEVFGGGSRVDPETGYESWKPSKRRIAPKLKRSVPEPGDDKTKKQQ